jgi:hypothetical protein
MGFGNLSIADAEATTTESGSPARCPLGFGVVGERAAAAKAVADLPTMTLASLSRHNGRIPGMPRFVSIKVGHA